MCRPPLLIAVKFPSSGSVVVAVSEAGVGVGVGMAGVGVGVGMAGVGVGVGMAGVGVVAGDGSSHADSTIATATQIVPSFTTRRNTHGIYVL